jgi:hypothetical protein
MFFLLFCLIIEESGSGSLTNGSGRPKNIRIRNTVPEDGGEEGEQPAQQNL